MPPAEPELSAPFRELFELSPDAIVVFLGGLVVQANPAALQLLRAPSRAALIGCASRDLIAAESLPSVAARAQAIFDGALASSRAEEVWHAFDGTQVDVEATAARASFLDGKAFIVFLRDITDRKLAAKAARAAERERWMQDVIDLLPLVVFVRDARGRFIMVNRQGCELFHRGTADLLGRTLGDIGYSESDATALMAEDDEILRTRQPVVIPERVTLDGRGTRRVFGGVKVYVEGPDGGAVLGAMTELTARRRLEEQLLHAQKMDGLGRLAGGVAHDFNNLLTVIVESVDHLADTMADADGDLQRIREASTRAAGLTRQLLASARQAPVQPRVVAIDALVARMAELLGPGLGEDIRLATELRAPEAHANVDPAQLERVVMNLAINARDAMPDGGELVLATRACIESPRPGAPAVPCIVVEIRDTGVGMDEPTCRRAPEPFFTTKPLGVGAGLGLSTSYGIVEQLGGQIVMESALGRGTTVRTYLPACPAAPPAIPAAPGVAKPGLETVLVLEDDPAVRRATSRMLKVLGYVVLDAGLPSEALAIARDHAGPIALLLTDVVMPEMNGVAAAHAFRALRPDAAVLFVSGYSHDVLARAPAALARCRLDKPFTKAELAVALRAAIDHA